MSLFHLMLDGVELFTPLLLLIGLVAGAMGALFGVGGGFFVTPALIMLGVPPTIAAATQTVQIFLTSALGLRGHAAKKQVDWRLAGVMLVGAVLSVVAGFIALGVLERAGKADGVIKLSFILLLFTVGIWMCVLAWRLASGHAQDGVGKNWAARGWPYGFISAAKPFGVIWPLLFGLIAGVMVVFLGVGGGFFIVPLLVGICGVWHRFAAGTSLAFITAISLPTGLAQALLHDNVHMGLLLWLFLGSMLGAPLGMRLHSRLSAAQNRLALGVLMLLVGAALSLKQFG